MTHHATPDFWESYNSLPEDIRREADESYRLLKSDPRHPSLHFKRVNGLWSVRATRSHRALGVDVQDGIAWFWIGDHAAYEKLIK